jgi:acyl-CoA thioester hydrolase
VSAENGLVAGHFDRVRAEWIDYNGHMNVAYYVLAFDHASDHFANGVGLDQAYRDSRNASFFVVDMNVTYKRELALDAPLSFTTQLLDFDDKRIRFFHVMRHAEEGFIAATNEILTVHIDMAERRSAPMAPEVMGRLERLWSDHRHLPTPEEAGRVLGIRRR